MIKGVGIIIKGVAVIERVAIFPETRSRHFPFLFCCRLESCGVSVEDPEDSEHGLLSTV